MTISSRTPEGMPNRCPVCGAAVRLEPSNPPGDGPCPQCGHLLWFVNQRFSSLPVGFNYSRTKLLGTGSFAEVWAGEGPEGVPVAIKMLYRAIDQEEAERAVEALEVMKKLRHAYLMPVWAYF